MTNQPPSNRPPRRGRHWVVASVTTPLAPLLLGASLLASRWQGCTTRAGAQPACRQSPTWTALATLGFWVLALASTVAGLVVGLAEGRTRRGLAHSRWISMTVVGLFAPWALAAYALGYGLGRLLPTPRQLGQTRSSAASGGWQQAVQLYQTLAGGQQPPAVYAPDLPGAGTVYMDMPFRFSRWFGADVTYDPGGMVAVGPPGFVAGAAVGRLIGTSIGYARAASLSRRQWREHDLARVVVDATATWCPRPVAAVRPHRGHRVPDDRGPILHPDVRDDRPVAVVRSGGLVSRGAVHLPALWIGVADPTDPPPGTASRSAAGGRTR